MRSCSCAHLRRERRLVSDGGRHAAEQRRHLRARLDETEDVVDEEEDVLALLAEVLGHRQAGQPDAQTGARRLVHLAEHERGLVDHARLGHLEVEIVALSGALADAGEHGQSAVLLRDVVDQLLDQDGLADARAAEQTDLAALDVRREQVDDLDAGLEDLEGRLQLLELRRIAVDRPALLGLDLLLLAVDHVSEHVEETPERPASDRHRDRTPGVDDVGSARNAVGRVHRDGPHGVVAQVLLYLGDQVDRRAPVGARDRDAERVVDLWELVGEDGVDDDALDLHDLPGVRRRDGLGHEAPGLLLQSRGQSTGFGSAVAEPANGRSPTGLAASRRAHRAVRPAVEPAEPVSLARLTAAAGRSRSWAAAVRRESPRLR